MNANELADELDTMLKAIGLTNNRVPDMLRQQQAEIEALKVGKIKAYDNGVEDGRKPNTHPVKELTDEEIMAEWEKSKDEVDFARAILRKAQE